MSPIRRLVAAFLTLAVTATLSYSSPGAFAGVPKPPADEEPVTLITGDRVFVQTRPGMRPLLRLEPAPGRRHIQFFQYLSEARSYVLPSDAAPLVAGGRLDRRLFDVTGLLAQGYGDRKRAEIPLLVRQPGRSSERIKPAKAPKAKAASQWHSLKDLAAGEKVWLDGKVALALDESVPRIGAPAAWQRGLDGSGVKVAVLDSGYDPSHPDLAGAVVAAQNFTNDPAGVTDTMGHGTHVASTLGGRGGQYRGVAPGVELLVGKVCADSEWSETGPCPESAILAGMQRAAEQGARVVNLSLSGSPTDGTDPLSVAVNDLTARFGTLFVAAAGNHYPGEPGDRRVATPAAADAALAVASLTKDDRLSDFSNAGPRVGDFALKPDLAAPGQDIVAARAEHGYLGEPVGSGYARMSGTSMATPHVAGAAAILAAAHPGWRADELKSALLSTATPVADVSAYAQGAGLADLDRATRQPVIATPGSLSMGYFRWPNSSPPPSTRTVTYRNDSASALALALEVTGGPAGMFTVDRGSVTVPAHGSVEANVTVTARPDQPGLHSAQLVARGGDGFVVRTTLGAYQEQESYDLRIATLDRTGAVPGEYQPIVFVTNLDTGEISEPGMHQGEVTLRLPKGRYAVWAGIATGPTSRDEPSTTLAAEPKVVLDRDTAVNFDARQARPVSIVVDRPDAVSDGTETVGLLQTVAGQTRSAIATTLSSARLFVLPTTRDVPGFSFFDTQTLLEPEIRLTAVGRDRFPVPVSYADVTYTPHFVGNETLLAVDGGKGTPQELSKIDVKGRLVLLTLDGPGEIDALAQRVRDIAAAGGRAVQLTTWHPPNLDGPLALPTMLTDSPAGQRLLAAAQGKPVPVRLHGIPASGYQYSLVVIGKGRIPAEPVFHVRDRDLAVVTAQYAAQAVDGALGTIAMGPSGISGWASPKYLKLPMRRTEYFSTGTLPGEPEPLRWHFDLRNQSSYDGSGPWGGWQMGYRGPYSKGKHAERFNVGPFVPSTAGGQVFWREPYLTAELPLYSPPVPGHFGSALSFGGDSGTMVVRRDGVELGRSEDPGSGFFEVGEPVAGRYEIEVEATRDAPWTTLNSRLSARWSFAWSDFDVAPTMPGVRFSAALDEHNRAPRGTRFPVTVWTEPDDVKRLAVEVSYDDGVTWTRTEAIRKGGQWVVWLKHPNRAHYVSLRATAADSAGNTVFQEVIRAYALG